MILPMLKAVDKMLEGDLNTHKVQCARAVIAEIINFLHNGPAPHANYKDEDLDDEAAQAQAELTGENID